MCAQNLGRENSALSESNFDGVLLGEYWGTGVVSLVKVAGETMRFEEKERVEGMVVWLVSYRGRQGIWAEKRQKLLGNNWANIESWSEVDRGIV